MQCSHALGDQGVVFRGGLWSALQPTNLALEGAHSTLEFYHDGKDLVQKREQVLEITKLLVEKARKRYKWQVNAEHAKWSMRWAKKGVVECKQLHLGRRPPSKVHVQRKWSFGSHCESNFQGYV